MELHLAPGAGQVKSHRELLQHRGGLSFAVDLTVYSLPAVLRTCYRFTDRAYFDVARCEGDPNVATVTLASKLNAVSAKDLVAEFNNELIDQEIREKLAEEVGPIRELIVAQAFAEGNLLDPDRDEGDYRKDPRDAGGRK